MKKELKILLFLSAIVNLAGGMLGPIYAVFVEQIGGNILTAGWAIALFSIATGVFIILLGKWEDRFRNKEALVVAGYSLNVVGFIGYLFITHPMQLFLIQIIFALAEAIVTPAFDGLYSSLLDRGRFASEWGMWEGTYYIVTAVAAFIGSGIAYLFGFGALFVFMAAISLGGVSMGSFLLIREGRVRKQSRAALI